MGSLLILLHQFNDPKYVGTTEGYPTHQLGMSNISVRVDSIERVATFVRRYGGSVFENTLVKRGTSLGNGGVGMIFGADPDGIQVELVEIYPLPHSLPTGGHPSKLQPPDSGRVHMSLRVTSQRLAFSLCAAFFASAMTGETALAQNALPGAPAFINITCNVADINRTVKFYVKALGFEDRGAFELDATSGKVFALSDNLSLKVHNLLLGPVSFLLRQFDGPKYVGETGYFPVHHLGMGNIAVRVADMNEAVAKVIEYGGEVEENTRALPAGVGPLMMFVSDSDGIRIELLEF